MGIGDELMACAHARGDGKCGIYGRDGKQRWSDLWDGVPWIARPGEPHVRRIINGPGCRPYVDYRRTTAERWAYTRWRCEQGYIAGVVPDRRGAGRVLIEPTIKKNASPNKLWGRWAELVVLYPSIPWAQCCPPGQSALPGVECIETNSYREAINVLAAADAAVLPEGGLHHGAAAIGKSEIIVLFGGMTSPANTGYDRHINLAVNAPDALGWRIPHPACREAWSSITPQLVHEKLKGLIA